MELNRAKAYVTGDIGCYTLGFMPPLSAMDTCVCMGASIGNATGISKVLSEEDQRKWSRLSAIRPSCIPASTA
jgi:indolepyruvate ferredoxin oxidoreductase, alpha subunit